MKAKDIQCCFMTDDGKTHQFAVKAVSWANPPKAVDENVEEIVKKLNNSLSRIRGSFECEITLTRESSINFRCSLLKWVRRPNGKYAVANNYLRRHKKPMRRRAYEQMQKLRSRDHLDQDERYRKSNAV